MTDRSYPGAELDVFQHAEHWKRYFGSRLAPHVRGDVLEVGAGIGASTAFLCGPLVTSWTWLEPDDALASRLAGRLTAGSLPVRPVLRRSTIDDLAADERFDTVLYIDVLEHVDDDARELERASAHLQPDGCLIVLAPAHDWLRSPFDDAVGHRRRYTRQALDQVAPAGLTSVWQGYLDSVGVAASLGNRLLLRRVYPSLAQVRFWDGRLVPISRVLDALFGYRLGKTVVAIWRKASAGAAR